MKRHFTFLLVLLLSLGTAAAGDLEIRVRDFTGGSITNRRVLVKLQNPGAVVAGPWTLAGDYVIKYSGTNGNAYFSNMLSGDYSYTIYGSPERSGVFTMPDTNGLVNLAELTGTNSTPTYYTSAQIDALLASGGGGGSAYTATNELFVSAIDGDDDTGTRGNRNLPFLTITAAQEAAQSGDTIFVLRGQYVENFLGADGVTFDLATDSLVGGALMPGPIFLADNISFRVEGNGFITATNRSTAFSTIGTGTIYLSGVTVTPNSTTNNLKGTWFTP